MDAERARRRRPTAEGAEASARQSSSASAASSASEEVSMAGEAELAEKGTAAGLGFLGLDSMRSHLRSYYINSCKARWRFRWMLLIWVLSWLVFVFSLRAVFFMSSQATERRQEALTSMCECDERARMFQVQVNATISHLQTLDVLVPTFHPSKNTSQSAIGYYLGGTLGIEAHIDNKLLHQLSGKPSITVKVHHTTTGESLTSMYGSNVTGSVVVDFGDPPKTSPLLYLTPLYISLVASLLIGYVVHFTTVKLIAEAEDGYKATSVLKKCAEDTDVLTNEVLHQAKIQSGKLEHEDVPFDLRTTLCHDNLPLPCGEALEKEMDDVSEPFEGELSYLANHLGIQELEQQGQEEMNLHVRLKVHQKLGETERNMEELGTRSKFIIMVKKLMGASIHSLPSRFPYLNKTVVNVSFLGLALYILAIGTSDPPYNFGRSRARLLIATLHGTWVKCAARNSDMISVGLRKIGGRNDTSGQQKHWSSHNSSSEIIPLPVPAQKSHRITARPWIVLASVIMLVLGIAVWLLLWWNRRKRVPQNELELLGGIGEPRRFQLHELAAATCNFTDENKLGQGGFGPVYRGYLSDQDRHVAIKVLSKKQSSQEQSDQQGLREFMAEVRVMAQLRHRNTVKLVGWCDSNKQLMLVYELMAQGSLDKHLYDPDKILTWQQRYKIALDLGSALLYLHRECEKCIVHGDIKPANVMLDVSHNAKLGDFGLARLVEHGEDPQTTQVVAGTPGYIDPEFINNRWPRTELDVYSFGVVLLEIACGKRPASRQPNGASSLLAWVLDLYDRGTILDAADERLNGVFEQQQMERVLVTGLWCAHQDPVQRPNIVQAMDVLRSADAELPMLLAMHDARRILRTMEEQAYGELPVADRPVHAVAASTYFTSKDSAYLLAEE